jgi:hypothetical protein
VRERDVAGRRLCHINFGIGQWLDQMPSALPRSRLRTSTASALPARPCDPLTSSRKSVAASLRVWWTMMNGTL